LNYRIIEKEYKEMEDREIVFASAKLQIKKTADIHRKSR
jgi:hypothetical protein